MKRHIKPISLSNRTSFEYSRCNQYDVEIASPTGNFRYLLTLELSFVLPYFCLHWTVYDATNTSGRVVTVMGDPVGRKLEATIRNFSVLALWEDQNVLRIAPRRLRNRRTSMQVIALLKVATIAS